MAESLPVAIVTGAANGIGRAIALRLGTLGYRLVLVDQDDPGLQQLQAELLTTAGCEHKLVVADVADADAWSGLAETLRHDQADIALLVQAAGVLLAGELQDCELADLERIVGVNLTSMLIGARSIGPLLHEHADFQRPPLPRGILNVASIFATVSPPGFAAYNATKAGVVALTETLRSEWASSGLTATVVLPGIVRTGLFSKAIYANQAIKSLVSERVSQANLTAEVVALAALEDFRRGRLVVPIGARATRLYWLKRLLPSRLQKRIASEADRQFSKADDD